MKTYRKGIGAMVAVLLMMGAVGGANDTAGMKQELADLKAKVAAMESAQAGCGTCGECTVCDGVESLTSMKKKACIKIGGDIEVPILVVHRDDDPREINGEDDEFDFTSFSGEASLKIRAYASKDVYAHIKLDLEDDGEQLEEAYFMWKDFLCTGIGLAVGKKEIKAWGQDETIGYMDGFVHGGADLLDMAAEQAEDARNMHSDIGTNSFPGEVDNTYAIETYYTLQDVAKLSLALFQDKRSRAMHEDRSEDHLGFQSGAAKLELSLMEGLEIELSGINRHQDSAGGDADDYSAASFGFVYESDCMPLTVFGEYLHGWDVDWTEDMDTDTAQLGMIWGLTDCVDFGLMGEWARIDNDNVTGSFYDQEDYYNAYVTLYYNFDDGIYMGLEYMHQWFEGEVRGPASDHEAAADMVGFVTGWSF